MSLFDLAWLIPALPFAAFVAIALYAHRDDRLSHRLALGAMGGAFVLAQVVFWAAVLRPVGGGAAAYASAPVDWLFVGDSVFRLGIYIDPATAIMLFMVPLVCLMIFIYSVGYMQGDPRYARFFAYISLFATGMLGLVVFDNLLTFFIFWEIMGTCSYLLIGFWYEKPSAFNAGLKAFLVTRVGDVFFLLGLVLLYARVGSLRYDLLFSPQALELLATPGFLGTDLAPATIIALLLFGGTVGKSAQFPLHVWLPDAMEGPTPISALIHAATMVSAGVFLVVRTFPIFAAVQGAAVFPVVAFTGTFTALFASVIAIAQNDIKRVLAFSTISQLGYMVAALGIGAYVAGAFHLITHAFFKALLFLASGSVLHGMEHGHHHGSGDPLQAQKEEGVASRNEAFNPNDMLLMGGLAKRMPRTALTFLIGGLALSGFPLFTAGFWSKDEILAQAWQRSPGVFWVLAAAAGITAFYTARQLSMAFLGEPRSEAAAHAEESVDSMTVPLMVLAGFSVVLGWAGIAEHFPVIGGVIPNWFEHFVGATLPHEIAEVVLGEGAFAWQPLALSVGFALGGLGLGWLVYGWKPLGAGEPDRLAAGMERVYLGWLHRAMRHRFYFDELYQATFVRGSIALAGLCYQADRSVVDAVVNYVAAGARAISRAAYWVDGHIIDGVVNLMGGFTRGLSGVVDWFDDRVIDGFINLLGGASEDLAALSGDFDRDRLDEAVDGVDNLVRTAGRALRPVQTGRVQDYLWLAILSLLALVIVFVV